MILNQYTLCTYFLLFIEYSIEQKFFHIIIIFCLEYYLLLDNMAFVIIFLTAKMIFQSLIA